MTLLAADHYPADRARRLLGEWAGHPVDDPEVAMWGTEMLQAAQVSALLAIHDQLVDLNETLRPRP